jgi:hypothetical protein
VPQPTTLPSAPKLKYKNYNFACSFSWV